MSVMGGGANLGTATYYITGDSSGATNAAAQANNALNQLSNAVTNNWFGLQALGTAFSALPAAVTAGIGAAVGAAIDFQDSMFEVSRATDLWGSEVEGLEGKILNLARRLPIATSEIASLVAQGAQLGVPTASLGKFAEVMDSLLSSTNLTQASIGDFARVVNVMQIPESELEAFANTLLEVGRNTAATETEILNVSRRMSGAAAAAGFTSDQVLGLGAALISLGPRAEAGGTAVNKTLGDMTRAVAGTTEGIETFAGVANVSVEEFSRLFGTDASQALAKFVTGLGQLSGTDQIRALDELGIKEARQVQALQQLALGTRDVGNEQRDLNAIFAMTANAYTTSNALAEIQAQKTRTLSGQIQLLKNIMFEFGASIGSATTGPLVFFVQQLSNLIIGFQELPGPIKNLLGVLLLITTAISALGAVVFLFGPRLVIAAEAFIRLRNGATGAMGPLGAVTGEMYAAGTAANFMGTSIARATGSIGVGNFSQINRNIQQMVLQSRVASGEISLLGTNAATAGTGLATLGSKAAKFGKIAGIATIAIAALGAGLAFFGSKQRAATDAAAAAAELAIAPNSELVKILYAQGSATGAQSDAFIRSLPAYNDVRAAAQALGIDLNILHAIITRSATPVQLEEFTAAIQKADKSTKAKIQTVLNLAQSYQASATKAGVAGRSADSYGSSQGAATEKTKAANDALNEQIDLLEQMAQAHLDLAEAVQNQGDAQSALTKAQDDYNSALAGGNDDAAEAHRIELELAQARFDQADEAKNLAQLEKDLGNVRARAARKVRDAELDLADAQNRARDAVERISKLEEDLAELRSGPSADELRDATNDLRNAELKLARAHQTVEDAEWNLQNLREEGASNRDIKEAEFALAEAKQGVKDSEDELIDSTKELNDLRDDTQRQEDISQLERDIQQAYRDSERASQDVLDRETELSDARTRFASDTDYQDAQRAIIDSQLAVEQAIQKVKEAEIELAAIRANRTVSVLEQAALDLTDAIFSMAQANAEVRKQQALANGETWDAADSAHALADELEALLGFVPDPGNRKKLEDYIATLRSTPDIPNRPDSGSGGGGGGGFNPGDFGLPELDAVQDYMDDLQKILDGDSGKKKPKSIAEQIFDALGGGSGVGGLVGGGIGAAVGGPAGAIVGALIGSVVGGLVEEFWPAISDFFTEGPGGDFGEAIKGFADLGFDLIGGLIKGMGDKLGEIARNIDKWIDENIIDPFKRALGINSPSTVFADFGGDIIQGLINGIINFFQEKVVPWFTSLPTKIKDWFKDAGTWLFDAGKNILTGLWNGIWNYWTETIVPWFTSLPTKVKDFFLDAGTWLLEAGKSIISSLWTGLQEAWNDVHDFIHDSHQKLIAPFKNAGEWLLEIGAQIARGLWNGLKKGWNTVKSGWNSLIGYIPGSFADGLEIESPSKVFHRFGINIMEGLSNGIQASMNSPLDALSTTMDMLDAAGDDQIGKSLINSIIAGMESQFSDLDRVLAETSGMIEEGLSKDYIASLLADPSQIRNAFLESAAGIGETRRAINPTIPTGDTFNLQAVTTADPVKIMNQYVWAKRIRLRGGVSVG